MKTVYFIYLFILLASCYTELPYRHANYFKDNDIAFKCMQIEDSYIDQSFYLDEYGRTYRISPNELSICDIVQTTVSNDLEQLFNERDKDILYKKLLNRDFINIQQTARYTYELLGYQLDFNIPNNWLFRPRTVRCRLAPKEESSFYELTMDLAVPNSAMAQKVIDIKLQIMLDPVIQYDNSFIPIETYQFSLNRIELFLFIIIIIIYVLIPFKIKLKYFVIASELFVVSIYLQNDLVSFFLLMNFYYFFIVGFFNRTVINKK